MPRTALVLMVPLTIAIVALAVLYLGARAELEALSANHSALRAAYENLLANYTSLRDEFRGLEARYSRLRAEHEALLERFRSLEANYTALRTTYDELRASYETLQNLYNSLKANYTALVANYSAWLKWLGKSSVGYCVGKAVVLPNATTWWAIAWHVPLGLAEQLGLFNTEKMRSYTLDTGVTLFYRPSVAEVEYLNMTFYLGL